MFGLSRKAVHIAVALIMISSGLIVLSGLKTERSSDGFEAEAKMYEEKPVHDGYLYMDNKDPAPKVEYDWIDCANDPKSVALDGIKCSNPYNGKAYQYYDLPFQFEFFGKYYTRTAVCGAGYIDFAGFQYYRAGYYYLYKIPYYYYENGFIAAWGGYVGDAYGDSDFTVYALEGETLGEKWVCFEWWNAYTYHYYTDPGNEVNFQIIIYESGLIKLQYRDTESDYTWYSNGYYAVVGIENPSGTKGVEYKSRSAKTLTDGLAVLFGKNVAEIESMDIDTGEDSSAMYAMHKYYNIDVKVKHPINSDMINKVSVTMGSGHADLVMEKVPSGDPLFYETDPNDYFKIDATRCKLIKEGDSLIVRFKATPTFRYPVNTFQSVTVSVGGQGVMPSSQLLPDVYWVENQLEIKGSLRAYSPERGYIDNGGWLHGNERFYFRGVQAVYPSSDPPLSPMSGAYSLTIKDEKGNEFVQNDIEGESNIPILAENDYIRKTYNLSITDVPLGADISENSPFYLTIDPYRPTPPVDIALHADSYNDRNIDYDNDKEVYATWEPSEDFESGIAGYYVTTFDPVEVGGTEAARDEAIWVMSPATSTKISFEELGNRRVYVWSVDVAGNPSVPAFAVTKIDSENLTFSEFSPGHQVWVNTKTPMCSILIDDGDGSGVSAADVMYQTSIKSPEEYSSWRIGKVGRDAQQVRLSVQANFENGKDNWIRFRAKDVAGNPQTPLDKFLFQESLDYNVWVDEISPSFSSFRPYETEYQNGKTVVISLDIRDKHGGREGSGIDLDTVEYRLSTSGKGLYGEWKPANIASADLQNAHIEMELDLKEGDRNYIQFRCYDNVANFGQSKEFNIMVNSAPVVEATIKPPEQGDWYLTTEKIFFDASGTEDPEGDELGFTWYSDIDLFLSNNPSFFESLSAGTHNITLIVNDPAHSLVRYFSLVVKEESQIDPMLIDSDGDGLYDEWEMKYGLNPYRPDSFIDSDHDTFTNLQEYQNRTDPTSRTNHPELPEAQAEEADDKGDENSEGQYRAVTLTILLLSVIVVLALIMLAFSKRRNFHLEVEDEKDLEAEEMDYRETLDKKRAERLSETKINKKDHQTEARK